MDEPTPTAEPAAEAAAGAQADQGPQPGAESGPVMRVHRDVDWQYLAGYGAVFVAVFGVGIWLKRRRQHAYDGVPCADCAERARQRAQEAPTAGPGPAPAYQDQPAAAEPWPRSEDLPPMPAADATVEDAGGPVLNGAGDLVVAGAHDAPPF